MNIKTLSAVILSLTCLQSIAQKKISVSFHTNSGKEVNTLDSADFVRRIQPDSLSQFFILNEFYKNGTLKFASKTSKADQIVLEGLTINYYPSGKRHEVANFADGKKTGDAYAYYPNGKPYNHKQFLVSGTNKESDVLLLACADSTGKALSTDGNGYYVAYDFDFTHIEEEGNVKAGLRDGTWKGGYANKDTKMAFTEEYVDGKLIKGESVYNDVDKYTYTQREVPPQYKGGMQEFYKFLSGRIQYPQYARAYNIQGRVLVNFVVGLDGYLTDYKIVQSPHDVLSVEALRVLQAMPKWIPGVQRGRPVRVNYTVPIGFAL